MKGSLFLHNFSGVGSLYLVEKSSVLCSSLSLFSTDGVLGFNFLLKSLLLCKQFGLSDLLLLGEPHLKLLLEDSSLLGNSGLFGELSMLLGLSKSSLLFKSLDFLQMSLALFEMGFGLVVSGGLDLLDHSSFLGNESLLSEFLGCNNLLSLSLLPLQESLSSLKDLGLLVLSTLGTTLHKEELLPNGSLNFVKLF